MSVKQLVPEAWQRLAPSRVSTSHCRSSTQISLRTATSAHTSPKASARRGATHRSALPSPERSPESIFPPWLLGRKDFQELSSQYGHLDSIDVWEVCQRPAHSRNSLEKRAVQVWISDSPFLAEMKDYQLLDICDRFRSVRFDASTALMRKGDAADCMYILVEGHVGIYIEAEKLVDCVYPKNVIGEVAVQSHTPRTATVVALAPVKAFRLSAEDYELAVFKLKLQHNRDLSLFLRQTKFFAEWDKVKIDRVAAALMVKWYRKGQVIYREGEAAHSMFVLREGKVVLAATAVLARVNKWPVSPHSRAVSTVHRVYQRSLRECTAGDVFGETELLDSAPRASCATCVEDSLVFAIRKASVNEIFTEKEKVKMRTVHDSRPPTAQILSDLEAEHTHAYLLRDALLDGLSSGYIPSNRLQPVKKQQLAEMFIRRHRRSKQRQLVRQEKLVKVEDCKVTRAEKCGGLNVG